LEKILLKNIDKPNSGDVKVYLDGGGYSALKKALAMEPRKVIDEIKLSGLLGRSSAFPVAQKLLSTAKEAAEPKYLVCNADEGEPGTFKDRLFLKKDPHLILESMVISGYAIGSHQGYIYVRGEYFSEISSLEKAIRQAESAGYIGKNILGTGFDFNIEIYQGAGAYVCGEETSLLKSMSGLRPSPAHKPPFPAQCGYLGKPTAVFNVETLANFPVILSRGGKWFSGIGSPDSPGTKLFCLSGQVNNPGVFEMPLGTKLSELVDQYGGGVKGEFKAVLPGGVASSLISDFNISLDYKTLAKAGSMLGPGSVIVINKETCLVDVSMNIVRFFARESCGKCSICREGTRTGLEVLHKLSEGAATADEVEFLFELSQVMRDTAGCVLGQSALNSTVSAIKLFRGEFASRMRN
jgi:NADH-quinone oxidoreductase subunit F